MKTLAKNTAYILAVVLGLAGGIALAIVIVLYMTIAGAIMHYETTWRASDTPSGTHSVYQETVNPQTPLTTNYYQGR